VLLGGADTYVGVAPCQEYAAALKEEGAVVEVTVYKGARHGFDGASAYSIGKGENYSNCIFAEQPDGTWKERISGATTMDAMGQRNEEGLKRALQPAERGASAAGPTSRPRQRLWLTSSAM
jgi:dienelactone hydrolase